MTNGMPTLNTEPELYPNFIFDLSQNPSLSDAPHRPLCFRTMSAQIPACCRCLDHDRKRSLESASRELASAGASAEYRPFAGDACPPPV